MITNLIEPRMRKRFFGTLFLIWTVALNAIQVYLVFKLINCFIFYRESVRSSRSSSGISNNPSPGSSLKNKDLTGIKRCKIVLEFLAICKMLVNFVITPWKIIWRLLRRLRNFSEVIVSWCEEPWSNGFLL